MSIARKTILLLLTKLRASSWRLPILRMLSRAHNWLYHLISFFALADDIHPKHAIQNYHKFFVDNIAPGDTVLDLGCGIGQVSLAIAAKAGAVYAIDISAHNISIAQKKHPHPKIKYIIGNALEFKIPGGYDKVIMSNVLEHIKDRVGLLKNLKHYSPVILIRVPMLTRDWLTVYKKNIGVEYRLDDTHYIEYTEDSLQYELKSAGWSVAHQHIAFGELYVIAK
jgi:2-polyprenyl-3-methyl-5-hydroxy-6-metoxy-1,4-benzoquinol methylase